MEQGLHPIIVRSALKCLGELVVDKETLSIFLPLVLKKLAHPDSGVRQVAYVALIKFQRIDPHALTASCRPSDWLKGLLDREATVVRQTLLLLRTVSIDAANGVDADKELWGLLTRVLERTALRNTGFYGKSWKWVAMDCIRVMSLFSSEQVVEEEVLERRVLEIMLDFVKSNG